jgi:hypothetical protein
MPDINPPLNPDDIEKKGEKGVLELQREAAAADKAAVERYGENVKLLKEFDNGSEITGALKDSVDGIGKALDFRGNNKNPKSDNAIRWAGVQDGLNLAKYAIGLQVVIMVLSKLFGFMKDSQDAASGKAAEELAKNGVNAPKEFLEKAKKKDEKGAEKPAPKPEPKPDPTPKVDPGSDKSHRDQKIVDPSDGITR